MATTTITAMNFSEQATWASGSTGDGSLEDFGTINAGTITQQLRGAIGTIGFHAYIPSGTQQGYPVNINGGTSHDDFEVHMLIKFSALNGVFYTIFPASNSELPSDGGVGFVFSINSSGNLAVETNAVTTTSTQTVTVGTWYRLVIHLNSQSASGYWWTATTYVDTTLTAEGSMTEWTTGAYTNSSETLDWSGFGNTITVEVAGYYIYKLGNGDTPVLPSGINLPPTGNLTVYVRQNGSNISDGSVNTDAGALSWSAAARMTGISIGATEIWRDLSGWDGFNTNFDPTSFSGSLLYSEAKSGGIGWNGDTILIATDIALADGSDAISGTVEIASVDPENPITINGLQTLAGPFTLYSSGIWSAVVPRSRGMFEDGKPMAKVMGASLTAAGTIYHADGTNTGYSTVADALAAVPGSWWNDDSSQTASNVYFSGTAGDPNTSGSTYGYAMATLTTARSYLVGGCYLHDLIIQAYTTTATVSGNEGADTSGGYAYVTGGNLGWVHDVNASFGDKHTAGCLINTSYAKLVLTGLGNVVNQAAPDEWRSNVTGQTTSWVSYAAGGGTTGMEHYIDITTTAAVQNVGSLDGRITTLSLAFYSHSGDSSLPFNIIKIMDAVITGGDAEATGTSQFAFAVPMANAAAKFPAANQVAVGATTYDASGDAVAGTLPVPGLRARGRF